MHRQIGILQELLGDRYRVKLTHIQDPTSVEQVEIWVIDKYSGRCAFSSLEWSDLLNLLALQKKSEDILNTLKAV
ncbi:hypothetical protein HMPREF1487_09627 [Pseudomonas sp. HPB0071]|nr:hypothetical protein HMPREF1487_09627 [Pseudomonas sp. HPB0071]